ncbi:NPCBM/NEW2 domain-containing protein [uncultured Amnibacterium sp.]|uniref:NPCBM/NEW2 domain-containing protein n=1 Tax=uncultured Amnibacterium sp. TaxID=1631851 RepID=UPI0035CBFA26
MLGRHSDTARLRRIGAALLAVATTALLAAVLPLVTASSAEAAGKGTTSVTLKSITDASTTGSFTLAGDDLTLRGTTSGNLVGMTLHLQVHRGSRWIPVAAAATVSPSSTFVLVARAAGVGRQVYRVGFAGSATLKPSAGTRAVTVWRWFPLVDQPIASKVAPAGSTAPHPSDALTVAGTGYPRVLAGSSTRTATTSSDFALGERCAAFSATVGLADRSASDTTATFTVVLDGATAARRADLAVGATAAFGIALTGNSRIRLEQTAVVPDPDGSRQAVPAWPLAKVLCSAKP